MVVYFSSWWAGWNHTHPAWVMRAILPLFSNHLQEGDIIPSDYDSDYWHYCFMACHYPRFHVACKQDYAEMNGWITVKLGGRKRCGSGKNPVKFGDDPDQGEDSSFFFFPLSVSLQNYGRGLGPLWKKKKKVRIFFVFCRILQKKKKKSLNSDFFFFFSTVALILFRTKLCVFPTFSQISKMIVCRSWGK